MSKISVYIIAYNEAEKIAAAIDSVRWADEIVVADSHSQDDTAAIATAMGARVVQIPFRGFGDLRNQAMAACRHPWLLSLDADERCTPEARDEIVAVINAETSADAYYLPRRNYFMGRWIKHSGYYPDYRQPQLFRQGALTFAADPVHERYTVRPGSQVAYLRQAIWQLPFRNFAELLHKANRYSSLGAEKLAQEKRAASLATALGHASWTFVDHLLVKRGFLDGQAGWMIAFGNFLGTFFKYAKLYELHSNWQQPGEGSVNALGRDRA